MFVDTNPFLFRGKVCGAMVRLSATPIVNVTSGGGETGFFVLQEQRAPLNRASQFAEMSLQQLRLAVTQSLKERAFEFTLPLRDAGG